MWVLSRSSHEINVSAKYVFAEGMASLSRVLFQVGMRLRCGREGSRNVALHLGKHSARSRPQETPSS